MAQHAPRRGPRAVAATVAFMMLALLAGSVVLAAVTRQLSSPGQVIVGAGVILMIAAIGVVGLVVAWHQPGNPIGWILLGVSICFPVTLGGGTVATPGRFPGGASPGLLLASFLLQPLWMTAVALFPLVILVFPDGRLPSPRWRWLVGLCALTAAAPPIIEGIITVAAFAAHQVTVTPDGQLAATAHPAGRWAWLGVLEVAVLGGLAVVWLGAVARQVRSWRRSGGERRQQLKWLVAGAVVFAAVGVPSLFISSALWEVAALGFAALPVSIGVGILRYRLYDIDRIISRTLAYAIVTALLAGVYTGLVLLATRVLPLTTPVAVAAATLAAAAAFNPLRRRVQRLVDRRFNRARYDADAAIAAFAARLSGSADVTATQADLAATIRAALEPAQLSVWLAGPPR